MKSFFLSFAMALFPILSFAQSYDALWKAEQQLESDGKPQSAYATVQKILEKALAEGHRGQALSARLRAAGLHQEWAPDSFFTDVAELEALRRQEQQPEARAVLASVLAEIYEGNSRRSQAHDLELTSEDMREWTREQYDSASLDNWRRSLEDIPMLAAASSKDWLPFVSQAEHSSYFHHDLLHLLWQRVRDHRRGIWRLSGEVESYQSMALRLGKAVRAEYDRRGNREASLLVALDLLELEPADTPSALLALKDTYSDLPLCTEVYLRLLDTTEEEISVAQKVALAEEILRRYPRYERSGEVRNRLNQLRQPSVTWAGNAMYYPGKTYTWRLTSQNASSVEILVYRLRDGFREEEVSESKLSVGDYFRKNASLVERLTPTLHPGKAHESRDDSLQWTAPAVGRYALVFVATTDEREARKKVVSDHFNTFRVTSLKTMTRFLTEQELEVVVVDAESGQPRQGANVALYSEDTRQDHRSLISSQQTSAEGRARFRGISKEVRRLLVTATAPAPTSHNATSAKTGIVDSYLPEEYLWRHGSYSPEEQTSTTLHLYTDRAIYRPGQTVHLSGVAYSKKHWDATTLAEKSYELTLRDANRKVVATQTVSTDAMGVLSADFLLPEGGLPGLYRIDCHGDVVSFRVEEYKRPTFDVKMDEAPALQWPQEHITLTGKAVGYNGVPVRGARVAGHYRFTYPYFWWYRHADSPSLPTDTVETDEEGKFAIAVPLNEIPSEALRHGLVLQLDVEVLSMAGETREGALRVPLCITPLRLNITMSEQQDRDRLQPPTFSLLTSTGKPAEGRITWTVYPAASEADVPANGVAAGSLEIDASAADLSPLTAALRALPSGDYKLKTTAQAGADTASAEARFFLFSMADKRLPHRAELWLYCPTDSFDLQHPARLQFGSSYEDVALYYSLVGKEGLIRNELIPLSDELRTMEIPYLPEYGDGVTAYFAFVKGGTCFTRQQSLKLSQPSKELKWQWTSFRDHTHPGEQETWTLRISAPDGTPVAANLMATIFDASLNQLQPHYWQLFVNRFHHLRQLPWNFSNTFQFQEGNSREQIFFPMKDYHSRSILFDSFDSRWTSGLAFGYGLRSVHPVMMKAAAPARSMGSYQAVVSDALEGRIAGLNLSEEESAPSDATRTAGAEVPQEASAEAAPQTTLAPAPAALRTNFNETAAFFPRLHTNPTTGEVTISFTLPESLTTW
ncbi:MAG: hypothetical protein K6C30_05805, partial [Bacteroidaceae bacterium]|nr:hypothetical protein [Bacteroidaceae bacterium]